MPVFKESFDNIIGYINIKDILPHLLNPDETIKFDINYDILQKRETTNYIKDNK